MKRHRILAGTLLILGLGISPMSMAHPGVHALLGIGHGPLHLGIDLGHLAHRSQHHSHHQAHRHGPQCYRHYPSHHAHWGSDRNHRWHRDRRQGGHHAHSRGFGQTRKPSHAGGHRHSRDCHLHYERGHRHWK